MEIPFSKLHYLRRKNIEPRRRELEGNRVRHRRAEIEHFLLLGHYVGIGFPPLHLPRLPP